jgi:hypothetical protein
MTVEGEKDDITGIGQCRAAHNLCRHLPKGMKLHHLQPKVGHYGIFNGSRFNADIVPKIVAFTRRHDMRDGTMLTRLVKSLRGTRRIEIMPGPGLKTVDNPKDVARAIRLMPTAATSLATVTKTSHRLNL